MKGPFCSYEEALASAKEGEEIWARDSRLAPDGKGWCVMTYEEATEYARVGDPFAGFYSRWHHWETIKESTQ